MQINQKFVLVRRFVCISRLFDNKHHFSDIISGALIGVVVAVFFTVVALGLHQPQVDKAKEESVESNQTPAEWGTIETSPSQQETWASREIIFCNFGITNNIDNKKPKPVEKS